MPDALPPVAVLLADLDAATLPLAGTELAFVMQGGEPRKTPVSSIGGGASTYAAFGTVTTYTPSNSLDEEAEVGSPLYRWPIGLAAQDQIPTDPAPPSFAAPWSRTGPGPSAATGDRVRMLITVSTTSDMNEGDQYDIALPFAAASGGIVVGEAGGAASMSYRLLDANTLRLSSGSSGYANLTIEVVYTAA